MEKIRKVLFTAAHSGFNLGHVPLGGGAAVCDRLSQEWARSKPFELELLGPSLLGPSAPREKELVRYSEWEYARFCRRLEAASTQAVLKHNPQDTVVLCNDISEGPDFRTLAQNGHSLYTIFHVDVVDYVTAIYLRAGIKPEKTTAFYRRLASFKLAGLLPSMVKLIWEKQQAGVVYSKGLIVPAERMKEVLLRCYPGLEPSKVHVVPWGAWDTEVQAEEVAREKLSLLETYSIPPASWVLLTLSRISPEKGQDRLLEALARWEQRSDFPANGITLFIAGEAAYMMGKRYSDKLHRLAARLKRCHVHFPGHTTGACKKALFELADLYVFPSRHESYGLTLLEALRAGKPVLATPSHGAREVFRPEFGDMIPSADEKSIPEHLIVSLRRLLSDQSKLRRMGETGQTWAKQQNFSAAAARLATLLVGR